ncbi:MAG: hypothetical protein BGO41_01345 [Clostridiales bacterium 38-18]|nr:MAG: hypothetical protein BGO41_01345 [Clostridiales bacterium 38-18]
MKSTGIVRKIDDNGRLVIPKELRDMLHLTGDYEVFSEDDLIIIKRYYERCRICASSEHELTVFKDVLICVDCIDFIKENI